VTVDEELSMLDESVRRLKIEYDVYFGGGAKKPPTDTEWRVQSLIKKFSDSSKLTYAQRFRYNSITQKYALFSDLWRQKLKIKEEGFRRPSDAVLGIQGMHEQHVVKGGAKESNFVMDAKGDEQLVEQIYKTMAEAREKAGLAPSGNLESFRKFVSGKTAQIRQQSGCEAVEYTVEVQEGQVRLKAKAKKTS
jgi:hypothetical protein